MENYTNWPNILRNSGYPQISGSFTVQRNEHSTVRYFIDTAICLAVRKPDGEELAPSLVLSEQDDKAGYKIYVDYRDICDNDQLLAHYQVQDGELTEQPLEKVADRNNELAHMKLPLARAVKDLALACLADQLPGPGEERVTADGVIHIPAENPETGYFYRRLVPMGPVIDTETDEVLCYELHEYRPDRPIGHGVIYWDGNTLQSAKYWPNGKVPGIHEPIAFA